MSKNVHIVYSSGEYSFMFKERGWNVVEDIQDADLVQFTGGHDVTPNLYGENPHPLTTSWPERDREEQKIFNLAKDNGIAMAGICRGGQFLNVMNGGKMFQDVNNHAIYGTHEVEDLWTKDKYQVTSTHHQMMRIGGGGLLIAVAHLATRKEHMKEGKITPFHASEPDTEVVYYAATNSLCFQPHPEFQSNNAKACREHYFRYIEDYLFNGEI